MKKSSTDPSENEEYREILSELHARREEQFAVGRLLSQISEQQLYGPYHNFAELVKHELDMSEQHGWRWVAAYRERERLAAAGVKVLPTAESQVRPLGRVLEERRVELWQLACSMSATLPPTASTVVQAIKYSGIKQEPSKSTHDDVREYRQSLRGVSGALAKAVKQSEDREFQAFTQATDEKSQRTHRRIKEQLTDLVLILEAQIDQFSPRKINEK